MKKDDSIYDRCNGFPDYLFQCAGIVGVVLELIDDEGNSETRFFSYSDIVAHCPSRFFRKDGKVDE